LSVATRDGHPPEVESTPLDLLTKHPVPVDGPGPSLALSFVLLSLFALYTTFLGIPFHSYELPDTIYPSLIIMVYPQVSNRGGPRAHGAVYYRNEVRCRMCG